MNRRDFNRLIGAEQRDAEYLPVALLLRSGYGCAGYYNTALNVDFADTCVLLNARLLDLQPAGNNGRPAIHSFSEFIEEIVTASYESDGDELAASHDDAYGKSIPLTAIPYDEIGVLYPVSHIGVLMQRAKESRQDLPTFLDLEQSEIVRLLRTKIW